MFWIPVSWQFAFGRNVLNLEDANSTEIKQDAKNPIVDLLPEQKRNFRYGGLTSIGS